MEKIITQAAKYLQNGSVISLPTETVYSLSANALSNDAIEEIYKIKGRRKENPLALLVGNIEQARRIVEFNSYAEILAEEFFPGPLSLILKKRRNISISPFINEGLETLAVRMPSHADALAVLNAVDFPVVGTSANPSGLPPAINAQQVNDYFPNIDMVIDGGVANIGIASTIIDLSGEVPIILRQGSVTSLQIEGKLQIKIADSARLC